MQHALNNYQTFYHLQYLPFGELTASETVFIGSGQQQVMDAIQQGMTTRQGLISFVGEAGLGKTTLMRTLLAQMAAQHLTLIYVEQSDLDTDTLALNIAQELDPTDPVSLPHEGLRNLQLLFEREAAVNRSTVLVLDNAHTMPMATLLQVGQLATQAASPVQVILVGQPALMDNCHRAGLQEQTMTITLNPLTPEESTGYIRHRLARASSGQSTEIFSVGAIKEIVKHAAGAPHALNVMCTDVLYEGYSKLENPISEGTAQRVLTEFIGTETTRWMPRLRSGAIAAGVLIGLVGLALSVFTPDDVDKMASARKQIMPQAAERLQPASSKTVAAVRQSAADHSQAEVGLSLTPPNTEPAKITPPNTTPSESSITLPDNALDRVEAVLQETVPAGGDFKLQIQTNKAAGATYAEGDTLGVSIQTPTDVYLRIDYYQANGRVVHLLPSLFGLNQAKAGEPFVVGTPDSSLPLAIAPPFGEEMLIVIASQQTIALPADPSPQESADHYVSRLAQELKRIKAQGKVAVASLRIHTQKRRERHVSAAPHPILRDLRGSI